MTDVVLPDTGEMRHIDYGMFLGCTELENIDIPDSVYEIFDDAFAGCCSLKTITIPEGVTNIDDEAFKGCSSLTTVRIPKSAELGEDVFRGCDNLKEIIYY